MLQLHTGVHAFAARDLRPEAVAGDEDGEFVFALSELLHLGLLVGRPAGEAGRSTLRQPAVSLKPSRGSTDQGSRLSRADSSART